MGRETPRPNSDSLPYEIGGASLACLPQPVLKVLPRESCPWWPSLAQSEVEKDHLPLTFLSSQGRRSVRTAIIWQDCLGAQRGLLAHLNVPSDPAPSVAAPAWAWQKGIVWDGPARVANSPELSRKGAVEALDCPDHQGMLVFWGDLMG